MLLRVRTTPRHSQRVQLHVSIHLLRSAIEALEPTACSLAPMLHDWKTIEYIVISLLVLWIVAGMFAAKS